MAVDGKSRDFEREKTSANGTSSRLAKDEHWRYPPYFTVDDLCIYRKRKQNDASLKDNLKLGVGSFKHLKTEYKRRFKNFYELLKVVNGRQRIDWTADRVKSEGLLKLEGPHDFQSEYNEAYDKHPVGEAADALIKSDQAAPEMSTRAVPTLEGTSWLRGCKRPTTLKLEGDYSHLTEHADNFIEYLIAKRADLLRTPTHLKLEGDMETKTESSAQFVRYDNAQRPALCKKFTQLRLEGDMDMSTENKHEFAPLELGKRPPLTKTSTHLHLDGDFDFVGEYARQFVEYKSMARSMPALPHHNLKPGDFFDTASDELKLFDTKFHPPIPFLREPCPSRSLPKKSEGKDAVAGLPSRVCSHPNLTVTRASNSTLASANYEPERERSAEKRYDSMSRRRRSQMDYLAGDGKMEVRPEYSSAYVDFPRERPRVRRPQEQMTNQGEVQYVTEKADKYTPHRFIEKSESCKRDPELKLEGRLECQPEYRKAYIDYLMREKKPPVGERRRAYDLLTGTQKAEKSPNDIVSSSATADNANVLSTSTKATPKCEQRLASGFPDESSASSPKPPRRGRRASRPRIAHFEDTAFGPTLTTRRSQTPSPVPPSRRGSRGRRGSRHSSPRLKSEWKPTNAYDSSLGGAEGDTAFFILDNVESRRNIRNSLYKEQKWMPSWNYST